MSTLTKSSTSVYLWDGEPAPEFTIERSSNNGTAWVTITMRTDATRRSEMTVFGDEAQLDAVVSSLAGALDAVRTTPRRPFTNSWGLTF